MHINTFGMKILVTLIHEVAVWSTRQLPLLMVVYNNRAQIRSKCKIHFYGTKVTRTTEGLPLQRRGMIPPDRGGAFPQLRLNY